MFKYDDNKQQYDLSSINIFYTTVFDDVKKHDGEHDNERSPLMSISRLTVTHLSAHSSQR